MDTDNQMDDPLFQSGNDPAVPEPDFGRVRAQILRRHRRYQAGLALWLAVFAVLIALSHSSSTQGVLLMAQGILLVVLVAWRRQTATRDIEAIACGVGDKVMRVVRKRRRWQVLGLCAVLGVIVGISLAWR